MRSFHGARKRRAYFEGWYLKQQNETRTAALIPAFHVDEAGRRRASLQVITDTQACCVDFPAQAFYASRERFFVRLGDCVFSKQGCELDADAPQCRLQGVLRFGAFTPPAYDIMGPFRFAPFMECRHSVFSLRHRVDGWLSVNGETLRFRGSSGYMEGDRGVSFPSRYIWTQCGWNGNCVMLSVADIPFFGGSFTGCIGSVFLNGKERRFATYLGVKLLHVSAGAVSLRQGDWTLQARLLESRPSPLYAPRAGGMTRTIRQSASCRARYTCTAGKDTLFDFTSEQASFESNWSDDDEPFAR